MRLVCEACDAKYSISDDKVAGKVFKIRCKRCSHVIVVRSAAPPVDAPPRVDDAWHAVVNNAQVGPFDSKELSSRRDAGELDDDSYVWREGMPDWVPLGTIETFRKPAMPSDEPASDVARLRGERNETSVLFTLGNLAKLGSPPPSATSPTSSPTPGVEGSGLIDIRALASTLAPVAKAAPGASMPEIPIYATAGFADPIVLAPHPRSRGPSRAVIAFVALAALLAIVTSVLIVVLVRADKRDATQVAAVTAPKPNAVVVEPPPAPPIVQPPATPAPQAAPQPPPPVTPPPPAPKQPPRRANTAHSTRPAPVPPQLQPAEATCDEITCEASGFAGKCCDRYKPSSANSSSSNSNLPDHLDASLLKTGIATIDVRRCSGKSSGMVSVSVKISPAGSVTGVTIKSSPDDAASACVTAAAKLGTFAKTQRGGSFGYVWRL